MIIRIIICLLVMMAIGMFMGLVLALFSANIKDETSRSILYDDEDYFKHEEPEWLRREDKE